MGRHVPSSRTSTGRILAIPVRGESGRKTAVAGYGLLVAAVFTALTTATLQDEDPHPTGGLGIKQADVFAAEATPGYMPTYLDGGGGIAGVPLTEEQRKALVREAKRRGLSTSDAYALAYGDNAVVQARKDGTAEVATDDVIVPNGPVYAKLPTSKTPTKESDTAALSGGDEVLAEKSDATPAKGSKPTQGPSKGKAKTSETGKPSKKPPTVSAYEEDPYYPTTGESFYDDDKGLKDLLPSPLDKVVDGMTTYSLWLDAASLGTPESVGTVQADTLTVVVEADLAPDLTLTTTLTTPLDEESKVEPVGTTVVTASSTGAVLAEKTGTCPSVHAVSAVAIGQTVDAVLEARTEGAVHP